MKRQNCLVCNSRELETIVKLGNQPYADTFVPKDRMAEALVTYTLSCDLCNVCGNIQTVSKTDPKDRYSLHDYSYTSSNSKTSKNHWESFCNSTVEKLNLIPGNFVVEIGSNDGFLLKQYQNRGIDVLGVDASPYVSKLANESGVQTIVEVFNSKVADDIFHKVGSANLVIANNVFNHSEDPVDFATGVQKLLKEGGYFIFEVPYWKCLVESQRIDQIYHEHVSYMTVRSVREMLFKAKMELYDVDVVDYHGGSLRVFARKSNNQNLQNSDKIDAMIEEEKSMGLYDTETYKELMKDLMKKKFSFLKKVYSIKSKGTPIIAVGAAAKGNTFLNFLNLDHSVIDYVTDASKHKQGKSTPLTNIPICGDEIFSEYDEVCAIILSWNISSKIKQKLLEINPKIKFLDFL